MQSHSDADSEMLRKIAEQYQPTQKEALKLLEAKARQMVAAGESTITAGKPGEVPLREEQVGTIFVRQMPDDHLALRISIGEAHHVGESAYLVYRGDPVKVMRLLERALTAIQSLGYAVPQEPPHDGE